MMVLTLVPRIYSIGCGDCPLDAPHGEALLRVGRPADAVREFEAALKKTPGRRKSIEGLARAKAALAPARRR